MGVWDGEGWRWGFRWRRELSARELAQVGLMEQWVGSRPLKQGVNDEWLWKLCRDGIYTVSSGYELLLGAAGAGSSEVFGALWECNVPSNIAVFGWRLLLDRLPTKDNLRKRSIIQLGEDCLCPICGTSEESRDHLMLRCHKVQQIW